MQLLARRRDVGGAVEMEAMTLEELGVYHCMVWRVGEVKRTACCAAFTAAAALIAPRAGAR